jgi:hypothetical protein
MLKGIKRPDLELKPRMHRNTPMVERGAAPKISAENIRSVKFLDTFNNSGRYILIPSPNRKKKKNKKKSKKEKN